MAGGSGADGIGFSRGYMRMKYRSLPGCTVLLLLLWLLWGASASAQAWRDALCTRSALAEGRWVKVRVGEAGVYRVSDVELRAMGFSRPEDVRVYGYGGHLLSQRFSELPPADLPEAPSYRQADGLLFYARGTVAWTSDATSSYLQRERNFYSDESYYFLSDANAAVVRDMSGARSQHVRSTVATRSEHARNTLETNTRISTFNDAVLHEAEEYSWANTGRALYENYNYANGNAKTYLLSLPGAVPGGGVDVTAVFAARLVGSGSTSFSLSVDGRESGRAEIPAIAEANQYYTRAASATLHVPWSGTAAETVNVTLTHDRPSGTAGRLDYIAVNYLRELRLTEPFLAFRSLASVGRDCVFCLSDTPAGTVVWDVTTPWEYAVMEGVLTGGQYEFSIPAGGLREFVAFDPASTAYPSVEVVQTIANQDLHGMEPADMVIVVPPVSALLSQAERLAQAHRERDGLTVAVVTSTQVYNEFSSGTPDATAYRRLMKMLYDRSPQGGTSRYLLLFGDCSYDNRMLTSSWRQYDPEGFLLSYQSEASLDETVSYISDDYFGFLDDAEGDDFASATLDVGIGRFPVRTAAEAKAAVDKTLSYMDNEEAGPWKQTVCFVADDGNRNLHVSQAEELASYVEEYYPSFQVERIYADAYPRQSSAAGFTFPGATEQLLRQLDEGALIVNYTGHGSTTALAEEKLLTAADIRALSSPRLPLWITATCDFTRFDDAQTSAGEEAFLNAKGGAIALFTTTRVAYALQNSVLNQVLMRHVFSQPDGERLRLGDIMRLSKQDEALATDRNKLNFALVGDPALTLAYPGYIVEIDEFDGVETADLLDDEYLQAKAGATITVRGHVADASGNLLDDFDGVVYPNLFDSREMARTLNNNGEGAYEYTRRGKTLFSGMAAVEQGQFEFTFRMPLDINYSDEPGLLNLYALHASDGREAGGSFSRFLVGGTADDVAEGDTLGPDMLLYLNEPAFRSGDRTNETPLFVAELEDEEGINTVGNGVGHDLTLVIDDSPALTYNLNDYYVPSLGDYTRGTVRFSIPELLPGRHTLTFRAWDLMNHSSRQSLEFEVVRGLRPGLLSVRCTQSPARESTTFVLEHNRPGSTLSVRLSAYDFSGREVWTHVEQGVSEGQEYYVEWDLCSNSGQRLSPGIYLYRASIASGGSRESTRAQKLLILAQ